MSFRNASHSHLFDANESIVVTFISLSAAACGWQCGASHSLFDCRRASSLGRSSNVLMIGSSAKRAKLWLLLLADLCIVASLAGILRHSVCIHNNNSGINPHNDQLTQIINSQRGSWCNCGCLCATTTPTTTHSHHHLLLLRCFSSTLDRCDAELLIKLLHFRRLLRRNVSISLSFFRLIWLSTVEPICIPLIGG